MMLLSPSKRKWIQQEFHDLHKSTLMDVAMLLTHGRNTDLVEAFCDHNSMLTTTAQQAGLIAERWTIDDYDLSQESDFQLALQRLRELRPKRLWLSPECGPFSQMQNVNQRTPAQVASLIAKREKGFKQWRNCIRLAWAQLELGGYFYIEQPQTCMTWKLEDTLTRQLLDELSSYCIRDQCFDGLTHPKSGKPMRKSTRIQSNDSSFTLQFGQRCIGHECEHAHVEGGKVTYGTSFYPRTFCQRAIHLFKNQHVSTPKRFVKRLADARQGEETAHTCNQCGSPTLINNCDGCPKCADAFPAIA